jgi:dUTP pyrophosphatase
MNATHNGTEHGAAIIDALMNHGDRAFKGNAALLKYKRISAESFAPRYATDGSACFDLMAHEKATIEAGCALNFGTGLAFEVPPTHVMLVFSRSGMGVKQRMRLSNCVGVIDSDYRGEVSVSLHNDGALAYCVEPGDRIAQAMLVPIPYAVLVEADELSETARGTGGLGSTGN